MRVDQAVSEVHAAADIHVLPSVTLAESETTISAKKAVVVAADGVSAAKLLNDDLWKKAPSKKEQGVGTCCLYFRSSML